MARSLNHIDAAHHVNENVMVSSNHSLQEIITKCILAIRESGLFIPGIVTASMNGIALLIVSV